jgi:Fe-only nitrogenase delta subunit
MEDLNKERIEQLLDYIMKNCLWQFHSRSWDRKVQNDGVMGKAMQLLCKEPVDINTPLDKCHWVDALCLVEDYKRLFPWLISLDKEELKQLVHGVHERLDHVTITGSLNLELNDQHY